MLLKDFDFTSPALTATWEQKLQEVEKDPKKAAVVKKEMSDYVTETVQSLKEIKSPLGFAPPKALPKNASVVGRTGGEIIGKCPHCSDEIQDRKFSFMCNGCDFKFSKTILSANITKTDAKALISGKKTKPKRFKNASGEFQSTLHFDGKTLKFTKA